MNKEEFRKEVIKLGVTIDDKIMGMLDIYCKYLQEYNTHTNLTAIKDEEDIYLKHFYDSLTIIKVIDLNKVNTLLDIGTGAGFPGLVLKLFYSHLKVTLVDSNNKKIKFLEEVIKKLNVDNIEVINNRIEIITKSKLNSYDVVTSRAVANLSVLTELSLPLVKPGGYFIPMKGSNHDEITSADYAIEKMKGRIIREETFELYNNAGIRNILLIEKIANTKKEDIRSYEKIVKRPLQKMNK